jgi:hypothetical protein
MGDRESLLPLSICGALRGMAVRYAHQCRHSEMEPQRFPPHGSCPMIAVRPRRVNFLAQLGQSPRAVDAFSE